MNEETKDVCLCKKEGVKKFFIVALGSFVGVFCALSLFAALNKPPVIIPQPPCPCVKMQHYFEHQGRNDFRGNFDKKVPKFNQENHQVPNEQQR